MYQCILEEGSENKEKKTLKIISPKNRTSKQCILEGGAT
jgi:hypothetical protein